ncbi:MAG: nitrophenyl compound nitroreductase subunit ArsF family protein [Cryomorphaceae bacterium]|nr:nitrophenyl compound nitroreductase subunit ArsF family protein [Cryomorphaceae bacterium]
MKSNMLKPIIASVAIIAASFACQSGNTSETNTETVTAEATRSGNIEVIQFHSEHRCMTCNKIEHNTQETLKNQSDVPFRLVNVDDPANEEFAEAFEATGTALFLHDIETGAKKNLTEFAFMKAKDEDAFMAELGNHIAEFKGQ